MLPLEHPDRIQIAFDDHRLVPNAGLLLPVTLAQHLGLRELVDNHVDLGAAPERANTGDKMLTLVASALAGGDCIDDADVLRTGGTGGALGCVVKAPSTLGTFLTQLPVGPCPPAGLGAPFAFPCPSSLVSTPRPTEAMALDQCREAARRCSCASGIMVFETANQPETGSTQ